MGRKPVKVNPQGVRKVKGKKFTKEVVMYKKILAPLDGSELSECSLEHVRAVAAGCQVAEVVLLRVAEPITTMAYAETSADWVAEKEKENQAEVENYLSQLADDLREEGIAVQTAAIWGRPADEILGYAKNNRADLIIMSTHGRSGLSRWVFGSVTERVLRHSAVPVLITPPPGRISGESRG